LAVPRVRPAPEPAVRTFPRRSVRQQSPSLTTFLLCLSVVRSYARPYAGACSSAARSSRSWTSSSVVCEKSPYQRPTACIRLRAFVVPNRRFGLGGDHFSSLLHIVHLSRRLQPPAVVQPFPRSAPDPLREGRESVN